MKETDPWRPSPEQVLMLRACLGSGDEAIAAWREWLGLVDMDLIDRETYKLFSRLFKNLDRLGVRDPVLALYKGIYRRTWYKNHVHFAAAARLLRELRAAGIETMLLKGAALVPFFYRDYGIRPLRDVDVMVPLPRAAAAIALSRTQGFREVWQMDPRLIPFRHGVEFCDANGEQVELHWRSLWQRWDGADESVFWRDALRVEVQGVPTRVLNPADQLLHVCVQGIQWDAIRTLNWIVDAMMLMTTPGIVIGWDALVARAVSHQVVLPVRETLVYLAETFAAPVPAPTLAALREAAVTPADRLRHELTTKRQSVGRTLRRHLTHYRQTVKSAGAAAGTVGFATYLALHTKGTQRAKTWNELPGRLLSDCLRRARWASAPRVNRSE